MISVDTSETFNSMFFECKNKRLISPPSAKLDAAKVHPRQNAVTYCAIKLKVAVVIPNIAEY